MGSTNRLEIAVSELGDGSTLELNGEVDVGTAPFLEAQVNRLAEGGHRRIRLDLRDVSFVDSQGIAVLFDAHRLLSATGGTLSLVAPSQPVRRVLELTAAERILTIEED